MIKAIFFDIDGTILDGNNGVPKSTIEALKILKEKGILRVIATGRDLNEIKPTGICEYDFDAYLTLNGQLCFDENYKVIDGRPLDPVDKKTMIDLFNEKKIPIGLCIESGTILNYVDDNLKDIHKRINCHIPRVDTYKGEEIYQALAYGKPELINKQVVNKLVNSFVTYWNKEAIDIIIKGSGKDTGIESYINKLGIKKEETMAFGDGHNDIEMIKYCGIGVALGNAIDELKDNSDYISDSIDKDGVYNALKHFNII